MNDRRTILTLAALSATVIFTACTAERSVAPQRVASETSTALVAAGPAQLPLLFVVDGVRYPRDQVPSLASDQISAIRVLKGHAALKEYGPDATYGVVVITTRHASPQS
ncbi:MAG: hypothetical protein ABR585_01505 [Gemmatimonadaceae bacterium]